MQLIPSKTGDGSDGILSGNVDFIGSLGVPDPNDNPLDITRGCSYELVKQGYPRARKARCLPRERVTLLKAP